MSLRQTLITCMALFWLSQVVCAQEESESATLLDRIFFGGNFGLQFGTITIIELSPIVGYHVTPKLSSGIGLRYEYFKDSRSFYGGSTNIYGTSVFSRYMLFGGQGESVNLGILHSLYAQVEYEMLSLEKQYFGFWPPEEEGRYLAHSVLVGGGLFQPTGTKGGFLFSVLWNLNETSRSPYNNPIIRVGFIF